MKTFRPYWSRVRVMPVLFAAMLITAMAVPAALDAAPRRKANPLGNYKILFKGKTTSGGQVTTPDLTIRNIKGKLGRQRQRGVDPNQIHRWNIKLSKPISPKKARQKFKGAGKVRTPIGTFNVRFNGTAANGKIRGKARAKLGNIVTTGRFNGRKRS